MDIVNRLKERGVLIINTALEMEEIAIDGPFDLALVNASQIAREQHLFMGGLPTVNTPLLGALSRASDLVSLDNIERGLKKKMPDHQAYTNLQAITTAYDNTVMRETTKG